MSAIGVAIAVLGIASAAGAQASPLHLARVFGDGMVVQRGAAIPLWGWAAPNAAVVATFHGVTRRAHADSAGRWSVAFPAVAAGGPYAIAVDAGGRHVSVTNVMVGDVWVASGQSNMELTVAGAANAAREIAGARDSLVRELKVPISWAERPADDLTGGRWAPADSQHVGAFSAVAYFFARELRAAQHVPIGIVNTTWGGSAIETWLSAPALHMTEDAPAAALVRERARLGAVADSLRARIGDPSTGSGQAVPARDPGLVDGRAVWADPALDDAGWRAIRVPGLWESQGYAGMDGVAWYRTTFTLTADEAARGARLSLGPIDDDDATWVNGVEVGRTTGYNVDRRYVVPASALHAGANVLAVRVADTGGGGGIDGAPDQVRLEIGGASRSLAGTWKFRVGELAVQMDGQRINKVPAITYNRMVHPLLPMPITGVIWYQGESNANDDAQARAYRSQFATLIRSWRSAWNGGRGGDIPFLWVQLPNFGRPDSTGGAGGSWSLQRESMTAALALPHTGQAIAIDVGEAENIHPKNKQDVGHRLALVARRVAYGEPVVASGPTYRGHTVAGGRVTIALDHVGGGLTARGTNGRVVGFAVAGPDHVFVRADARIDGIRVIVSSDVVPNPIAVRYAWADNPIGANLYNREGLPAAPFRTDAW